MRYQIKDKHNFFIREDGDSSMVLFKEKHDQFILNGTGLVMFNLILENNQTQKVLEELKKIYENIEIAVLENDLQDIIRMLKMYGILVMEQEIEENVCKHTDISAVDENDYEKVGRFVEENRCSDFFVAGGGVMMIVCALLLARVYRKVKREERQKEEKAAWIFCGKIKTDLHLNGKAKYENQGEQGEPNAALSTN